MHRAGRSISVTRTGVRTAATAAKPAPRPLGKWELPKPVNTPASSSGLSPNLGKWAASPPSTSTGSSPTSNKWARPTEPPSRNNNGSSSSRFGLGQRTRPQQAGPSKGKFNNAGRQSQQTTRTKPSSNVLSTLNTSLPSFGSILKEDHKRAQQEQEAETIAKKAMVDNASALELSDVETAAYNEEEPFIESEASTWGVRKMKRNDFKERGSVASRLASPVDVSRTSKRQRGTLELRAREMEYQTKRDKKHERERQLEVQRMMERDKVKVKPKPKAAKKVQQDVFIPSIVSVGNLARLLKIRLDNLQRKMFRLGMEKESSYDYMLTSEYASLIAMEYNRNPVVNDEAAFDIYPPVPLVDRSSLPSRPPVVTIMGHVDHGKTTLLDTLRSTSVAKGEAGGITQHIGAFSVPVPGPANDQRTITFLDTPGHAAFSAMRARGAGVTDVVVLVVAADDGIMPQTKEVLELVKKDAGKVSLVVAINKIDKPGVDPREVETALLAEGIQLETFGGDIPVVHVSGMTGQNLPQLIETISAVAEMQDLRAEKTGPVHGYVLESKVHKGLGPVATILLMQGELKPGAHLICGTAHAKVRLLTSPSGSPIKTVHPGFAAVVSGWKELPRAGEEVLLGTEAEVKKAIANRIRKAEMEATLHDLEAINQSRMEERERREEEEAGKVDEAVAGKDEKKELRIIIKGDVSGSVEAVAGALEGIGNNLACVKVISTGVGDVTESDVMRAKAVGGTVVAFSVNIPRSIESIAAGQSVPLMTSTIIYRLMDEVKERVIALLPTTIEKRVTGEASVIQLFEIHLKGKKTVKIAGSRVTNGVVEKSKSARIVRKGQIVFEGKLETLKHLKKDITEAGKGLECGIGFEGFDDLREGDLIQMYQEIEKPGSL